jgi:hypothetical protein
MNRNTPIFIFLVLTLIALVGCSSQPAANDAKKAEIVLEKIQGKAQTLQEAGGANDAAMNAGGPSVYLWQGVTRYRLFLKDAFEIVHGDDYVAEGIDAQKAIDEIGDPDQGKNGYPLPTSCSRVVKMAWPKLAFDAVDSQTEVLRARVKRYPARHVFLVTRIWAATAEERAAMKDANKDAASAQKIPEVNVPADKQRASLIEGPTVQPAPLWEPAGGTVQCKVVVGPDGKVSELDTGTQLCEAVAWSKFSYKPLIQGGHPVKVNTEVEVRYDQRK